MKNFSVKVSCSNLVIVCALCQDPGFPEQSWTLHFFLVLCKVLAVLVAPVLLSAEVSIPSLSPQFHAERCRSQDARLGIPLHY